MTNKHRYPEWFLPYDLYLWLMSPGTAYILLVTTVVLGTCFFTYYVMSYKAKARDACYGRICPPHHVITYAQYRHPECLCEPGVLPQEIPTHE